MDIKEINNKIQTLRIQLKTLIKQRDKIMNKNTQKFKCSKCNKYFPNTSKYTFHIENICGQNEWKCSMCKYVAKSKKFLERHELCCAPKWCPHCKKYWSDKKKNLTKHIEKCKLATEQESDVKTEIKENTHALPAESSQSHTDNLPDDDGCKLATEQESDIKTETKENLHAHPTESSQSYTDNLSDDDGCKLASEQEPDVKTEIKENPHAYPLDSFQPQTDDLPADDGCKLPSEQESDVKTEIKEELEEK